MALGEHLGSHQYRRVAAPYRAELVFKAALAANGVAIDTVKRQVGKSLFQAGFCALRAGTHSHQALRTAAGALDRYRRPGTAVMAGEYRGHAMQGQARIAGVATSLPTAAGAQVHGRVAASVKEYQHLRPRTKMALDPPSQGQAQTVLQSMAADVEHVDGGQRRAGGPFQQQQPTVAPAASVAERLQRRCRAAKDQWNIEGLRAFHRDIRAE